MSCTILVLALALRISCSNSTMGVDNLNATFLVDNASTQNIIDNAFRFPSPLPTWPSGTYLLSQFL